MQNLPLASDSNILYNEGENQIGWRQQEGVKANLSIPL